VPPPAPDYGQTPAPYYGQPPTPPAPSYGAAPGYGYPPPAPVQPASSGMYVAAAVLNWVVLGLLVVLTCGVGLIAAAWFIPMTIFIHKGAKDPYKHTALGVCTLLFCNLISGILMLVEDTKRQDRPKA